MKLLKIKEDIRNVKKGEVVSYGNKNMLQRETKIAIVPIGYAHGIQKQIEKKKSYVLIRGEKAYIQGEICMDMILVDVTDIETADITKLRTIVINLIDALSTSGLIRQNSNLE